MKKLVRSLKKKVVQSNKRAKRYRMAGDLPEEVNDLIQSLTHYNSRVRATVRSAKRHPWIKQEEETSTKKEAEHHVPIVFMQCGDIELKK